MLVPDLQKKLCLQMYVMGLKLHAFAESGGDGGFQPSTSALHAGISVFIAKCVHRKGNV